ncbi:MAG: branched-chain amino acid ABC transporter permease [Deltaproteobacteria bacterium]|nr:branched-chain amino acid ABC transporter permease [Deltaproteobacteria bacterium]
MRDYSNFIIISIIFLLSLFIINNPYFIHLIILSGIFGILAIYWNLLDGYLGLINFGYAAFFGVGAYTSAILSMKLNITLPLSIFIGGILAGIIGILVIIPCLRMVTFSTAIVTLAFGEIMRIIASSWTSLTKGEMGLWGIPPLFEGANKKPYGLVIILLLLLGILGIQIILKTPFGLAIKAVRDDEISSGVLGIYPSRIKIIASGISCFMAGIVGGFYAHYILTITPAIFGIAYTIQIMAMSLLGGKGTIYGPLMGTLVLIFLGEGTRFLEDYRTLIYGAIIILIVMLFPQGLAGIYQKFQNIFKR